MFPMTPYNLALDVASKLRDDKLRLARDSLISCHLHIYFVSAFSFLG
jgi:hypothetical protein